LTADKVVEDRCSGAAWISYDRAIAAIGCVAAAGAFDIATGLLVDEITVLGLSMSHMRHGHKQCGHNGGGKGLHVCMAEKVSC
jgi:hypothetical protein